MFLKPARGTFRRERARKVRAFDAAERAAKAAVRERDQRCRWPDCACNVFTTTLEVAHIVAKSLGGPSTTDNMILLCSGRHRGTPSLHSKQLDIRPLTDAGADGRCEYWEKDVNGAYWLRGVDA